MAFNYDAYLRMDQMPHIWCPGCGHGMVMKSLIRAIHKTGWDLDKILVVSGIGCAGRIATYLNFDTVHTTHGRALPFATGAKLANPDLHVIIATGDGDALAIGGNHFIHACRRNIDMTMVLFNNGIYGMTGGQYSPATPCGDRTTTSPYGNVEPHFDTSGLAVSSGAGFVARGDTYRLKQLDNILYEGLMHPSFSVVEVIEGCFTTHGRRNRQRYKNNMDMLLEQKNNAVNVPKDEISTDPNIPLPLDDDGPDGPHYRHGILHQSSRSDYLTQYDRQIKRLRKDGDVYGRVQANQTDKRREVRFAGSGGQGLILSGIILAEAAVAEGLNVVQSQSYGPEARGGSSKCDLILSKTKIEFPKATRLDILVALTQKALDKYAGDLRYGGTLIMDSQITPPERPDIRIFKVPIIQKALELKAGQSANVVALGALHSVAKLFPKQAMREAVLNNVPPATKEINEIAFKAGIDLGKHPSTKQPSRKAEKAEVKGEGEAKTPRSRNGRKNGNGSKKKPNPEG